MAKTLKLHILLLLLFAALCASAGNVLLSIGMKQVGRGGPAGLQFLWSALSNGYVIGGTFILAVYFGFFAHALSRAELSFVLPITALTYLFSALLAKIFLHEPVSAMRWAGTLVIIAGVAVVLWSD